MAELWCGRSLTIPTFHTEAAEASRIAVYMHVCNFLCNLSFSFGLACLLAALCAYRHSKVTERVTPTSPKRMLCASTAWQGYLDLYLSGRWAVCLTTYLTGTSWRPS